MLNNKPDIVIRDNKRATCVIIDVAVPGDRNVIKEEAEKILNYKDVIIEIERRKWNVKTKVIPVIKVANGTISESLRQYLSNIAGKHEIKELQKKSTKLRNYKKGTKLRNYKKQHEIKELQKTARN